MRIPKFWARARVTGRDRHRRPIDVEACGWSDTSLDDARRRAEERALRALERLQAPPPRRRPEPTREYGYGDVPPREEVIDRLEVDGREVAVVTRNAYGALVLNTDCVLFVDVDEPQRGRSSGLFRGLLRLFGRSAGQAGGGGAETSTPEARVRAWLRDRGGAGARLYRTAQGWRVAVVDQRYDPDSERVREIFRELGADPLYIRLTQRQHCFRARLTPKPWRCGCAGPPVRYPWADARAEEAFRRWETQYRQKSAGYTTCLAPECFGRAVDDPVVRAVLELHDRLACTASERLA